MLDFPSGPSVGQKYPASPIAGVPTYTWDGAKWSTAGVPIGGKTPVYTDGSSAMTAALVLAGDPVNPTDAADKHYVDSLGGGVPAGTKMVFWQAAAPVGWTQITTQNDKALRVVSGTGGGAGGSNAFSSVMAQTTVGNHSLSLGEVPAGLTGTTTNSVTVFAGGNPNVYTPFSTGNWATQIPIPTSAGNPAVYYGGSMGTIQQFSANVPITVNISNGGGAAHTHGITMDIQYIDVIIASKN